MADADKPAEHGPPLEGWPDDFESGLTLTPPDVDETPRAEQNLFSNLVTSWSVEPTALEKEEKAAGDLSWIGAALDNSQAAEDGTPAEAADWDEWDMPALEPLTFSTDLSAAAADDWSAAPPQLAEPETVSAVEVSTEETTNDWTTGFAEAIDHPLSAAEEPPVAPREADEWLPEVPGQTDWQETIAGEAAATLAEMPELTDFLALSHAVQPEPFSEQSALPEEPLELPELDHLWDSVGELPVTEASAWDTASTTLEELIASIDTQVAAAPLTLAAEQNPAAPAEVHSFVAFTLGAGRYAVPISNVVEMEKVPRVTAVPHVPDFVRGLTNLRGEILAVLDLRVLLGLEAGSDRLRERMLVVRVGAEGYTAGLIVDEVNGIAPVLPGGVLTPSGAVQDRVVPLLSGLYEHRDHLLNLLDLNKVFGLAPLRELQEA